MELLSHRGYHGSIETSLADKVLHGKILFIDDLITYEAENISQLEVEFKSALEDYLETCASIGKTPQKSVSGQFNVRIPPELHRLAQIRAAKDATNLNSVATRAFEKYLKEPVQATDTVIYSETESFNTAVSNVINFNDFCPPGRLKNIAFIEATNAGTSSTLTFRPPLPPEQEYAH